VSASVLAFEDRPDLIGAFAPVGGVYRDVVGRSANNIPLAGGQVDEESY
jgi:hypothetical protein